MFFKIKFAPENYEFMRTLLNFLFMIILCSGSRYSNGGGSGSGSGSGYQKRNPGEELFCRDNFLSISALQMIDQVD